MTYKTVDDIEREKAERQRDEMKKHITEDTTDVLSRLLKKPKQIRMKWKILKWCWYIFACLFTMTFIFGIIWLLRALIKSLFFS